MDPTYDFFNAIAYFGLVFVVLILSAIFVTAFLYIVILLIRMQKREEVSLEMVTMEVRISKDNEIKIDTAEQFFASFASLKRASFWNFFDKDEVISLEIVGKHSDIRFYVTCPNRLKDLVDKQIYSFYPSAEVTVVDEPNIFFKGGKMAYAAMRTKGAIYKPIRAFKDLPTDSLSTITSALSKMNESEGCIYQLMLRPAPKSAIQSGKAFVSKTKKDEANPEKASYKVDAKTLEIITDKLHKPNFEVMVRFVVCSPDKNSADLHLRNLKTSFNQFNSDLNGFTTAKIFFKYGFMMNFIYRFFPLFELPWWRSTSVLSSDELASLFHFPNKTIETPHIQWLKAKTAPVHANVASSGGTFIGTGYFRGIRRPVHILPADRMRHTYIIGKTGTGKSELLLDMVVQDIKAGKGVCVIDPHGDLIDDTLAFMPPERAEDVILFDPSDTERPLGLNLLEAKTEEQKHFITSAIINLMYKLYDPQRTGIIGPRFEHAVRNAMLTIMCEPGATFVEIVRIMTDPKYVQELLPKVEDPMVRRYWTDQIAQTNDFHKSEVLDYIVSKFGRFVTNKMMRNIIGQSKSAFDFRTVMDEGKILLINLSKGKLGEENSTFLGLLIVPKILAAAMSRVDVPIEQRKDFFLYVDEFQNFATPDFATILSEARKYKLALTVANQFIGQMDDEVKNAVFGNVGTIMTLRLGVTDANFMQREYSPTFGESDIINIERYHAYVRTIFKNDPIPPFSVDMTKDYEAHMAAREKGRKIAEAIMKLSRYKYGRPQEIVEAEIVERSHL